ncbi:threonine synthase [Flavobacterium fontis]|uniref:Threonine synthase n=1 Tax=Flavobacterium fontis TaxID=1124188 RepID=A0A1M4ZI13_9FLAO|nr:threonine synthase [Flavobacterium fontis]SHF17442.1 threonine synthase [Flavobacterium fontis]
MNYYSLNNPNHKVSFKEAVIAGIAPDRGLYYPEQIPTLSPEFIANLEQYSREEVAFQVMAPFVGESIPEAELRQIIEETLCFDFPCVAVHDSIFSLELYHGPTLAFKDVGARFMSRCLGYFNRNSEEKVTVLVATSGDTGGAVASGFLGVKGVNVVILYPSGKVSDIQERQLTTLGQNIHALEVDGVFDDCQDMVKTAFLDTDLKGSGLTSANSINVARWLPQMLYYFFAWQQLKKHHKEIIVSCPSGNFGNICAGLLAKKMGLPIAHFVAATNVNDTVPEFLQTGKYIPKPSKPTISNAMDVGNPSNFVRIQAMYDHSLEAILNDFSSYSYTDEQTRAVMQTLYSQTGYIAEPHGAVGYLGLQETLKNHPYAIGLFLETAHPVKFLEEVENTLSIELPLPEAIAQLLPLEKVKTRIATYAQLKSFLLNR